MKFTSEKLAEDRARQFEEQKLRNQNLEVQMQELKTILVNMSMNQRPPSSPLIASIPGDSSSQGGNRLSPSTDSECAHHVLEEMPHSTNTIEVVQIDESSEDGGEALFEVVNRIERDEDPSQILVPNEPNSAKESSVLVAHQVLDEMSEPKEFHKLELSDELRTFATPWIVPVEDEVPTEEQYSTVNINEEQDDSKILKVSDLKDATSLLLFKNEFADLLSLLNEMPAQEEIRMNYREVFCFDPGGGFLDLVGDSFKLAIIPQEKSGLCYINEEVTAGTKPPKDFRRKHRTMLLGCLLWFDVELESFAKNVWGIMLLGDKFLPGSLCEELNMISESLGKLNSQSVAVDFAHYIVDINATFGHEWTLGVGEVTADLLCLGKGIIKIYNSVIYAQLFAPYLPEFLMPDYAVGWLIFHMMPFDPGRSELKSNDHVVSELGLMIHVIQFGVAINETRHQRMKMTDQHVIIVAAKLGVVVMDVQRAAPFTLGFDPACLGSAAYMFDMLIRLGMATSYLLAHLGIIATGCRNLTLTWSSIYICIAIFIFDLGGKWFLHSELKVTLARLIFDPGREYSMLTDKAQSEGLMEIMQSILFFLVLQLCSLHDSALKLLILEDKDHLKEGVLLQDYKGLGWFYYYRPGFSYFL